MITELIKDYLIKQRNCVSLEKLSKFLKKKNINISTADLLNKSNLFKLHNGIIFLKSTLLKSKEDFFKEFNDYLHCKIVNKQLREDLIKLFMIHISDSLFMEWLNASLERKIIIFDLLFNMLYKQENIKDKFKSYYNELVEFYTILLIYSLLLSKSFENNFNKFIKTIQIIDPLEDQLKSHLFNILTLPDVVLSKLNYWKKDFKQIEKNLQKILEEKFLTVKKMSHKLYERVIENEIKEFDILFLLSRFEHKSYYEWLSTLIAENDKPQHNLFEDLGF